MRVVEVAARIGWTTRGVLYLLVAVLVARLPGGSAGQQADKKGAFATIAESTFGGVALAAVALGLGGFAAWRTWAAVVGDDEKPARRLSWLGSALVYGVLAVLAVGVLTGDGSGGGGSGESQQALTARVLDWPGGPYLVGAIALVIVGVGVNFVRKGVQERFLHDVDEGAVPDPLRGPVRVVGVAGWLGRAIVWALSGFFLLRAAVRHDPNEPIGLDESLRRVAGESWGTAVLWVVVAGLAAYAVLCAATALWLDPEPDS